MSYRPRSGRFRSNKKRLGRIRWTRLDRWFIVLLALLMLLSVAAGAWLGYIYSD